MSEASRVLDLIDKTAATSSRLAKEELLKEILDIELGRFVIKWAYDPFVTYGLTPVRQEPGALKIELRPTLVEKLLKSLAAREITGHAAQREVAEVMQSLEPAGGELLFRILSKDLKCGIAAASINAVMPGFIPVFSVMRAHKFEEKRIKTWPQIVEPKLDGYRYTFLCRDGHGGFFSRSGIRQEAADHLVEPMIKTALLAYQNSVAAGTELHKLLSTALDNRSSLSFMADGEMIMPGDFNENGALRRKDQQAEGAKFHIFDLMSYADFDAVGSVGKPYLERRKLVEEFVRSAVSPAITKTPRYFANSFEEISSLYEQFLARGLEGAMVKNPTGLYDKKKSYGWLKIKSEESEDLPIVGVFNGEEHSKNENILGGAIVRRENGVHVRVGGGWSDEQRVALWEDWKHDAALLGIDPQVGFKPGYALDPAIENITGFKLLGRLAEVLFQEETPDGSLRHPRFKRFRDDKAGEVESKEAA